MEIKQYIQENEARFLDELASLIRIPSISALPQHKEDMLACAERWRQLLLEAGADKVAVNSAALRCPSLIDDIVKHFGSQICVLAIDAKYENNKWQCYLNGGRVPTERELFEWAKEGYERGAGEILFTSMNHDGTKTGFANDALSTLNNIVGIPIIASGGAGDKESFRDAFSKGHADAALAASVFHYGEIKIPKLKEYLHGEGIEVRL